MTSDAPDGLAELLEGLSPPVRDLMHSGRGLIRDVAPDVVEVVWPNQRIVGFGVGPKKMSEQYVYLAAYAKHVNLGFYYGADLDDPEEMLKGTGNEMRHIRIEEVDDLEDPSVRSLIEQAKGHLPRLEG